MQSEKFASCHPVLLGHDVVQNRVDRGTQVKEYKGDDITVMADDGHDRRAHLCGFGDQVTSNVKGKPAEHEGKHHYSQHFHCLSVVFITNRSVFPNRLPLSPPELSPDETIQYS